MAARWTSATFALRAVVGEVEFDHGIVGFTSSFEPNGLPVAAITVPVGRGYRGTQSRVAEIHTNVSELRTRQPAKVFLKVTPLGSSAGDAEEWPSEEFVIFEGFAVGTGWQRGASGASFTIHILHWLSDLHYSSSVSGTTHPTGLLNLAFDAAQVDPCALLDAGASNVPLWVSRSGGGRLINEDNIVKDLWGEVLQPWMVCLASTDRINALQIPGVGKKNDSALKALNRIAPIVTDPCYVPLALEDEGVDGPTLAAGLRMALLHETFDSFASTTLWGKLIGEWVPEFFLGLVPRVENALVVPFTPGLRTPFTAKFQAKDYDFANLVSSMPRIPRAVGIFHSHRMLAGSNGADSQTKDSKSLAGFFQPGGLGDGVESPDGLVLLKGAPRFISDDMLAFRYSRGSSGAEQNNAIATSRSPDIGDGEVGGSVATSHNAFAPLLNAYAQQWYVIEMLKARHGEISGKLRFDVGPFSTVKIEAARDQFIPGDDLGESMYASVLRVSQQIDAQQQKAGTAFSLAHIRTEAENNDDKTSIAKPPLYKQAFTGCSMVDGF